MPINNENEFPKIIMDITTKIICDRLDVMELACSQRSKFENWLKFELASELAVTFKDPTISIEPPYPSGGKADLLIHRQDQAWYVEIKTGNTNWRIDGVENKSRPITDNITYIIQDIQKLREKCRPSKGLALFILFPIPMRIWSDEREKLNLYLHRIETACSLPVGSLITQSRFILVKLTYGVLLCVVEV